MLDDDAELNIVLKLSAEEYEKEQERKRSIGPSDCETNNNNEVPVIFPIKKLLSSPQTNITQLMLDGQCDNFNSDDENANENDENDENNGFIVKQGNHQKNQDIRKFGVNKNAKLATNQYSMTEKYKHHNNRKSSKSPPEKTDNPCHDESTVVTERVNNEYQTSTEDEEFKKALAQSILTHNNEMSKRKMVIRGHILGFKY